MRRLRTSTRGRVGGLSIGGGCAMRTVRVVDRSRVSGFFTGELPLQIGIC